MATQSSLIKDLTDEFKILLYPVDHDMLNFKSTQAQARIVDMWIKSHIKSFPEVCKNVSKSAWKDASLPVISLLLEKKAQNPALAIPVSILMSDVYINDLEAKEALNLLSWGSKVLESRDLENFRTDFVDFLDYNEISTHKKAVQDILLTFQKQCLTYKKEEVFSSFMANLDAKTLEEITSLLPTSTQEKINQQIDGGLITIAKELHKKEPSVDHLKKYIAELSDHSENKMKQEAILEEIADLVLDDHSLRKSLPFLEACASSDPKKVQTIFPEAKGFAWYLERLPPPSSNKVIDHLIKLNLPSSYLNKMFSSYMESALCFDSTSAGTVATINKATRMLQRFKKAGVDFNKFDFTVGYSDVYEWFYENNSKIKNQKLSEAYTLLATLSPPSFSGLVSSLYSSNNQKWDSPISPTSFKIRRSNFTSTIKNYEDEGDKESLKHAQKLRTFLALHEKLTIASQVRSPVTSKEKSTQVPPKRKM